MKRISSIILLISLLGVSPISAQKKGAPFKMLIVSPDSATIDPELTLIFHVMEERFRDAFYKSNAELAANARPTKSKKDIARLEWQFNVILNLDSQIKNLKFYQIISKLACMSIVERSKIQDRSSVAEISLDKGRKKTLYDSLPYDSQWQYLLSYKDLRAKRGNEAILFSGTISLMDIKTNQVLFEKQIDGKSNDNYIGSAEDALYDFVEISSNTGVDFILNRQKK